MMKKISILLLSLVIMVSVCSVTAFAEKTIPEERQLLRLTDNADILNDTDEEELLSKLDEISERQQCDVAAITVAALPDDYDSVEAFADDIYDYSGFGMGSNDDGILLVLVMDSRDWHITTYGYGITAITDAGLEYMSDKFLSYFSDGDYADGFTEYATLCDEFITQAKTGAPYDTNNLPKNVKWLEWIVFSLALGIAVAFGLVSRMKNQMKTVALQQNAGTYLRDGSLNVEQSRDTFLFASVAKTPKPKESSSNGGSSTHVSSSGRSHGGGGGKF